MPGPITKEPIGPDFDEEDAKAVFRRRKPDGAVQVWIEDGPPRMMCTEWSHVAALSAAAPGPLTRETVADDFDENDRKAVLDRRSRDGAVRSWIDAGPPRVMYTEWSVIP